MLSKNFSDVSLDVVIHEISLELKRQISSQIYSGEIDCNLCELTESIQMDFIEEISEASEYFSDLNLFYDTITETYLQDNLQNFKSKYKI